MDTEGEEMGYIFHFVKKPALKKKKNYSQQCFAYPPDEMENDVYP